MEFEWDPDKNVANQRKHGVAFEDAVRVFDAAVEDVLEFFDDAHSDDEERFITMGPIRAGLVLVVWTERTNEIVRVISARWATPRERRMYIKHMERTR